MRGRLERTPLRHRRRQGITFHKPVAIGNIVEVRARLIHTGRTSMHSAINVCSRDPRHGEYEDTTSCLMVFVALDADARPTPVPKWEPTAPEDRAIQARAMHLRELGQRIQEELRTFESAAADGGKAANGTQMTPMTPIGQIWCFIRRPTGRLRAGAARGMKNCSVGGLRPRRTHAARR